VRNILLVIKTIFPYDNFSMTKKSITYASTGVDVHIEAKAARILYEAAKKTWNNTKGKLGEVLVPFDDFSGLRYINVAELPKGTVMYGGSDGIATKTELAERINRYDTLAFDLMAMICDDAVIRGAEPILVKSVLVVNSLGQDESRLTFIQDLAKGYLAAATEAGVAVINGEIAQHNDRMGRMDTFSLDWSGDVTWFAHESRLLSGKEVKPGDYIIGLEEVGPRSNGITLIRHALSKLHKNDWENIMLEGKPLIDHALSPSCIYSRAIVDMTGGWSLDRKPKAVIHAVAHISGGGIPEKLGRALRPSGYGASIEDPFSPPALMLYCQQAGIDDFEAYSTWHMGQGMIVIAPEYDDVIKVAAEHNILAKVIGRVTETPGIFIESKGLQKKQLQY
jgi:phosphoribosylformylglycinamidine cyclo-ligase